MSEVTNNSALSQVLSDYSLTKQKQEAGKTNEMGRNEFLKLLVAQLENQDPTEPQDNGEFVAQLAQFSSLEEAQKMSSSFENFNTAFQSSQHLQATSLVGRPVHVAADTTALLDTGGVSVIADMPRSVEGSTLSVYDQAGTLVDSFNLGAQQSGRQEFIWTGTDANNQRFPSGEYTFKVAIPDGDGARQVPTFLSANVNSVTIEPGGSLTLNLAGIGPKSLADVIQIN
jgi:flagellar basal-body rod modification protein FlgD